METYIVRIYRRGTSGDTDLVGTVEVVSTQQRISFRDEDELMVVLNTSAGQVEVVEEDESQDRSA